MIKGRENIIRKQKEYLFPEVKNCAHGRARRVLFDYKLGCVKSIDVCPHICLQTVFMVLPKLPLNTFWNTAG